MWWNVGEPSEELRYGVKGAAALFSGDSSYGDKCGEMWCGNVNIDKPITG